MLTALKPIPAAMARMKLRPYQSDVKRDIYAAWNSPGVLNVLAVLPTGAGKTVTFADILYEHKGASVAVAHRQELVGQISLALAREGIQHKIIAPKKVIKFCVAQHIAKVGQSFYKYDAPAAVAGVDTLIRRDDAQFKRWCKTVTLWVMDEAHHVLKDNKWGTGVGLFPNAKGLGVTATPTRADGMGLGRHADGVFDRMVEGPPMRALIDMGYLTDYRVVAPKTQDLDLSQVPIGSGGELQKKALSVAVGKSKLVGDVVKEYMRFAMGKKGVTFATDIDNAQKICDEFNAKGVPALMVHGGSTDKERTDATAALANGDILNLVNVDLFGEGFDLPAIEVVSMARPTKSFSLFVQQFGRALRLLIGPELAVKWDTFTNAERRHHIANSIKPSALIIDHVGNTDMLGGGHALPDAPQVWTLDRREKRGAAGQAADDVIPTRTCTNFMCLSVYERIHVTCPYCGTEPLRAHRSGPEHVDGDLTELSPELLARMRGEVEDAHQTPEDYAAQLARARVPPQYRSGQIKRHTEKYEKNQLHQDALQESIRWWGGVHKENGLDERQLMRKFYYTFGVDALSAQALHAADALMLATKINEKIARDYPR